MAAPIQQEDFIKLKSFIEFVNRNPTVLNMPQLQFVKDFIEKFGGKVPDGDFKMPEAGKCPFGGDAGTNSKPADASAKVDTDDDSDKSDADESSSEPESDIELDMEGVIEADKEPAQPMGDSAKEPTDEEIDQAGDLRSQAAAAYSEQKFDEAIGFYTKAIELNPANALFYAKRGQAFLKLKKPNACIRDCDKALELNCDSAAAYKFRGRAHRLLGQFEKSAKDLRQACKLDFDEEADEWLREVTPNAQKIEQHRIKQERKQAERDIKNRQRAQRRARKEQAKQQNAAGGGFPGGFPGAGGFPGGGMPAGFDMSQLKDPVVAAAMQDILSNPANISKYMSNPKIFNLLKNFFPGVFPGSEAAGSDGNSSSPFAGDTEVGGKSTATGGNSGTEPPKSNKKESDFVDDGLD
ncbi:hypothetical protein KR093_008545 [Drosophila rubida]|uniref:STI1 domain-containing protein n=1 Tax=Drosophila rubida TaxID=30044 RepID=A0AAD4KCF2_9MUSC|nr:hypothetical protein KR093_008545 [Drosophila rubida]